MPSNCVGKQMVVKLAPWTCKLYENKTVACNPPYIEVIKKPAECTAKYESAAVFEGTQLFPHTSQCIAGNLHCSAYLSAMI